MDVMESVVTFIRMVADSHSKQRPAPTRIADFSTSKGPKLLKEVRTGSPRQVNTARRQSPKRITSSTGPQTTITRTRTTKSRRMPANLSPITSLMCSTWISL